MASETIVKQKEEIVAKLAEDLKDTKLVLLVDYRGITVDDVTKLRNELRSNNAEYRVIKNNIVKRALDKNGESGLDDLLNGPTAVITSKEDYLAPANDSRRDYYFSKITIKTRTSCKTCWKLTWNYFKTCSCIRCS